MLMHSHRTPLVFLPLYSPFPCLFVPPPPLSIPPIPFTLRPSSTFHHIVPFNYVCLHFSLFMTLLSIILRIFVQILSSSFFQMQSHSFLLSSFLIFSLIVSSLTLPTTVTPIPRTSSSSSSLPSTIPTLIVVEATASAHPLLSQTTRSVGRPMLTPRIVTPVPSENKMQFTNVDQTKS
ncbi:hypothetical protein PRIPAC_79323 [Pristionchus pacificus]|uniref:Uncharacterized protein n=1 Tax=Pristionchus pacificus TaxID=54126 RepID=A0A2A6C4L8_PRIPA|nr:hypothetical protein PRIPAC_79323 [Pristionchus pacificus]|eukprot:PDM73057.1 hypothetical protein PRIPAC_39491 [Pristionchus pacificus]